VIDCGIRSVQAQGFRGIYRGMGITMMRDIPGYFAYFGTLWIFSKYLIFTMEFNMFFFHSGI
jgi:uncharacterized membrane protein (GlpM family)